jgi:hypothetical protein
MYGSETSGLGELKMAEKKQNVRVLVRKLISQLDYEDPAWRNAAAESATEGEEVDIYWIKILKALGLKVPKYKLRVVYVPVNIQVSGTKLFPDADWYPFNTRTKEILWQFASRSKENTEKRCHALNLDLLRRVQKEKRHDVVRRQGGGVGKKREAKKGNGAKAVPVRVPEHDVAASPKVDSGAA